MPFLLRTSGFLSLLMLLAVGCISPAYAQRTWGHTDLDTLVSVRTPFRGEEYQEDKILYFKAFFATGYANRFVMVRMDMEQMARDAPQKAKGGALVMDIDKFLHRAIAKNFLQFTHPHFTREYPVSLVTKPDLTALHRFYTGIDDVSQDKATMEVTWFSVGRVIYMFFCTTVDTTSQSGIEERQHYFSTIQLAH